MPEKKIEGNPYVLSERKWLMEKTLLRYLLASNEKLRLGSLYRMVNMDLHFSMKIRIHSKREEAGLPPVQAPERSGDMGPGVRLMEKKEKIKA